MLFRMIFLAALLTAPLVLKPTTVSAQDERGLARAEISTAQTEAVKAWYNNRAGRRPTALPAGLRNRLEVGEPLPPGIRRTRIVPVAEIVASPDPGDGGDTGDDGSVDCPDADLFLVGEDLVCLDPDTEIVVDMVIDFGL